MHVEGSGSRSLSRAAGGGDRGSAGKEGLGSGSLSPTSAGFRRTGSWFLVVRGSAEDVPTLGDSLVSCNV